MTSPTLDPVRKSITVAATPAVAFQVFTQEMDAWWPRTHHIGNSPMKRIVVTPRVGGSIYTEQEDGTDCPWASVAAWEPPHRFVMTWQIDTQWKYEPEISRCSEVEITFTPVAEGTLVQLEHRNFERHGAACERMRADVSSEGGWGALLSLYAAKAAEVKA